MTTSERNKLLIGIGCSAVAGFGTGYLICSNRKEKKHREELKKARKSAFIAGYEKGRDPVQLKNAYMSGVEDGIRDGKTYIDNLKKVLKDESMGENVNMGEVIKKVNQMMEEDSKPTELKQEIVLKDVPEDCNKGWIKVSDDKIAFFEKNSDGKMELLTDENGKAVAYPIRLFMGEDGKVLDDSVLRKNFADFEKNPDILKEVLRISELNEEKSGDSNWGETSSYPDDGSVRVVEAPKNDADIVYVSSPIGVRMIGQAEFDSVNHQVVFHGAAGTNIAYPANLFIGPDGDMLDSVDIRNNIRKHEHNLARLNLIWNQMGWGAYIPDLDGPAGVETSNSLGELNDAGMMGRELTDEEINNWDLNIDGETYADGDLLLGDEPEEKTRERERYLDEVNRYIANPEEAPRIISRQEFDDECYLDKVYFDYYDVDNKFIENTDVDNEVGAYDYFGITDGKELFNRKSQMVSDPDDDDPDIVHVKNFKMNCVIEVTRYHRSYEAIKDGGAYVQDGSTN